MSNLSQKKRKEMLAYLSELKKMHNDDASIRALNEIETALTEKKYGLVWEEHSEKVDEMLVDNIPVFTEVKEREITADEEEGYNFLLEGDNLHSLKLLEKTHKGKIDVIYIDPPYNLGGDFVYNDDYVGQDDAYRHSKWLSFMNKRLNIARNLLSKKGAIYISINDYEYANLKLLCDSLFSEANYQSTFIWKSRQRADSRNTNMLSNDHEYILVYGRSSDVKFVGQQKDLSKYTNPDNDPRGAWASIDLTGLADATRRPNLHFDIVDPKTGNIYPPNPNRGWSKSRETISKMIEEDRILFPKSPKGRPREKKFVKDLLSSQTAFSSILEPGDVGYTTDGTRALTKIMGSRVFNFPKSIKLIKTLIKQYPNENCLVLDFFAGSGTTGQAVIELNKEDGGKRNYILCTNNENNICEEVTYRRLKNIQEDMPHNFKYFKTGFIKKFSDEEDIVSDKLLSNIKEMVELENMCQIDGIHHHLVLTDEELMDMNILDLAPDAKLYMPSYLLLSKEIEDQLLARKIQVIEIPDYYFLDELMEVGEL